jgi:hypothetical protein
VNRPRTLKNLSHHRGSYFFSMDSLDSLDFRTPLVANQLLLLWGKLILAYPKTLSNFLARNENIDKNMDSSSLVTLSQTV